MIHFIIGTEAELIKIFPLMVILKERNREYNFISTGQHPLHKSEILKVFGLKKPDYILYQGSVFTSFMKMFKWFIFTLLKNMLMGKNLFKNNFDGVVVVHGDTLSTLMGALVAKRYRMKVAHVEAGARSFDLLNPFPEEITRRIVSRLSDYHFCAGDLPLRNLNYLKDKIKINIAQNTIFDAYKMTLKKLDLIKTPAMPKSYFIFIVHRTENLLNRELTEKLFRQMIEWSKNTKAVLVIHHTTKSVLDKYGLMEEIRQNPSVIIMPRLSYPKFLKILLNAEFIATDGGSNQQECAYIGIPTLLLRKVTDGWEGLGKNIILSKLDFKVIKGFYQHHKQYRKQPLRINDSPSKMIIDKISEFL